MFYDLVESVSGILYLSMTVLIGIAAVKFVVGLVGVLR